MKLEITDVYLRGLKPPEDGRIELRDTRVAGLVLRVMPSGVATWSVRTRTKDGKQTRPKLGTWPALSIKQARDAAMRALSGIQTGADSISEKRAVRAARKAQAEQRTVAERLVDWQAGRVTAASNPWSERYAAEVARVVKREIEPRLGKKHLGETTREDWTKLVAAKRKAAPAMASLLYRIVSSFLGHAEAEGWIATPMLPRKGAARLAPMPASRERVLTDAELAAVWRAAEREAPKLRAFVRLAILTGAREKEVADISVAEVDLDAARWAIPGERTKSRSGYVVPLSPLALDELRNVWPVEDAPPGSRLLGRSARAGFTGFSRLKSRIDVAITAQREADGIEPAALSGWRWHDLRRTCRTGMTRLGVMRDHAEAAINHLSGRSSLERTYDRHDYADEIIAALTTWQGHVAKLLQPPGKNGSQ